MNCTLDIQEQPPSADYTSQHSHASFHMVLRSIQASSPLVQHGGRWQDLDDSNPEWQVAKSLQAFQQVFLTRNLG